MISNVLTIAGSDPSGGAGIQADLKTFAALGCYGMAVITSLTAQNTRGVRSFIDVPDVFVKDQIAAIFDDIEVAAVKIGMLSNAGIIHAVADCLEEYRPANIVLDPVMVASSGDSLIDSNAIIAIKERLIPLCDVLTPNIPEAEKLSRKSVIDMEVAAKGLLALGSKAVLLKGGHLKSGVMRDILAYDDEVMVYKSPRIDTPNTHGTGCTLSAAIAAYLSMGESLADSCGKSKQYLNGALKDSHKLNAGRGCGSVYHGWRAHG